MAVKITAGNTDDRKPFDTMTAALEGKIVGDNGYISKHLFQELWNRGLHLITGIRRNMKTFLMPLLHKLLLCKRSIIETLFDRPKSHTGLEHSRHVNSQCLSPHPIVHSGLHSRATQGQNGQNCRPRRHSEHCERDMSLSRTHLWIPPCQAAFDRMRTCDRMRTFIRPQRCGDLMTAGRYGDAPRRVQIRFKSLQLAE